MHKQIMESTALAATPISGKPGELMITLITPGQGSSGTYSVECLEAAGADEVFPAGTHMYLDHPSESDQYERPERSVKDLGAVLTGPAVWNAEASALQAPARPFSQHRELLSEMQQYIGVSIRAAAEVNEAGSDREILKILPSPANSVDFVTRAGRGGTFQVLESARPGRVNARARRHGVSEASVNDRREALSVLIREEYATDGDDRVWAWLRDFDETTAWFEIENGDDAGIYAQTYDSGSDGLPSALTGERTEVRVVTQYVPANPAGNTEESAGGHMAKIQIEESAHTELLEKAGRVTALEAERDTAIKERDAAKTELSESKAASARSKAADAVISTVAKEHEVSFSNLEITGLKADLPVKEGELDDEAFTKAVEAAAAEVLEARGTGRVTDLGGGQRSTGVSESDFDNIFNPKGA
ncbi:hypothetical protein HMPREF0063_11920 [Aeromicrobium marinum DSM 15272]|uniref:Capsid maturation protease n=1 Tax=Aeromicrobium marinum DSM 15272 TaxID=585531 RepID=E2SDY4_9ACTN|nr:hypothetical protein [Aeromicrobium marinum]EFQ82711.1 hypothetical protein HMPREF0063_11920 [Aeromicrobium marinum DSM 15272]